MAVASEEKVEEIRAKVEELSVEKKWEPMDFPKDRIEHVRTGFDHLLQRVIRGKVLMTVFCLNLLFNFHDPWMGRWPKIMNIPDLLASSTLSNQRHHFPLKKPAAFSFAKMAFRKSFEAHPKAQDSDRGKSLEIKHLHHLLFTEVGGLPWAGLCCLGLGTKDVEKVICWLHRMSPEVLLR